MQIKSILAVAAVALALGLGPVSAADHFNTLDGITAQSLTPNEMGAVVGELTCASANLCVDLSGVYMGVAEDVERGAICFSSGPGACSPEPLIVNLAQQGGCGSCTLALTVTAGAGTGTANPAP